MYVTTRPTEFSPTKLICAMVLGTLIGTVIVPFANRIQGIGSGVLDDTQQAASTLIDNFHTAQDQQGELFQGVQLP